MNNIYTRCVVWSTEDFEYRAIETFEQIIEEDLESSNPIRKAYVESVRKNCKTWEDLYDKNTFHEALDDMINHHDANDGISWSTIDYYLREKCERSFNNE